MITKIKLKNWRSHLDTEINFSEGTNCFVGPMGSGKTSVIDAICFALFGTFLQLQQKKLKLEDIIMKKPSSRDKAEITVFFDIGDKNEWSVKRVVTKGRSTAELRKNGELVEGPQSTKVTKELERIMKMNYDLFSRAVYSEQNQLDMFLVIPKGKRMKKIDELLLIDKFENARKNTKSLINKCLIVSNEKESVIQNLEVDENLKKLDLIKREFFELKEKEEKMRNQLNDTIKRKSGITKDIDKLKQQQKRLQTIKEEIKKFTALLDLTDSDIEKIKEDLVEFAEITDEELRNEVRKTDEELKTLNESLIEEKSDLDNLKGKYVEDNAKISLIENEKIPELEQILKELDEKLEKIKENPLRKLNSELNKNKKELEKNQIKLQKSLAKISEIEDSMNELSLAGSTCPVCDSRLTKDKKSKLIEKKKKLKKDLKKELENYNSLIKKIESKLPELENRIREIEKMQDRVEEIKGSEKELKILEKELKSLKSKTFVFDNQKKMFEKNIKIIEENINRLKETQEKMKQILFKKEEVDIKLKRLREYRQKLTNLGAEKDFLSSSFSPSILEKFESDYRSIISLESQLETNLKNLSEIRNDKQKFLEEIENKKKMLENYRLEIRKISAISDQLRLLESALEATQEQLRKDFVSAVNEAMQSIWTELYPYKDIYNIRLGIEEGDYVLQLQDSTGWIPADGVASGGERSMACLALRIAFSLVLAPQLRMLVLDEPTANLDVQAREILANVLRERIIYLVEQCFLITHDDRLKEAVSGFCYDFNRDKSRDEATKVTLVSSPTQI
ncbi:MAG: AAA family ATPase [Candidatus Aenigmarchaeota archaeon]|nr:AAA family ATPase [Candidatus Aenigmarchaeota archaeon]